MTDTTLHPTNNQAKSVSKLDEPIDWRTANGLSPSKVQTDGIKLAQGR